MKLIHTDINCKGRSDRFELFPFGDCHIGKRNCNEYALRKQVAEVLRRSKMPNRHVRAILGGDLIEAISPADVRRFNFDELADWFVESDADATREKLGNMIEQEVMRAVEVFKPISHLIIGAIDGNHERQMKKRQYLNVHNAICGRLGIDNLTNEACVRMRFTRSTGGRAFMNLYIRHGYGGGRTAGAEPNKLARLLAEWEWADICLTGHTHTYCIFPPKPVLYVSIKGKLPQRLLQRYRFAANWGCWLMSHLVGAGSYESDACYPASPMMTLKVVVWPFWQNWIDGHEVEQVKIELREYPIL